MSACLVHTNKPTSTFWSSPCRVIPGTKAEQKHKEMTGHSFKSGLYVFIRCFFPPKKYIVFRCFFAKKKNYVGMHKEWPWTIHTPDLLWQKLWSPSTSIHAFVIFVFHLFFLDKRAPCIRGRIPMLDVDKLMYKDGFMLSQKDRSRLWAAEGSMHCCKRDPLDGWTDRDVAYCCCLSACLQQQGKNPIPGLYGDLQFLFALPDKLKRSGSCIKRCVASWKEGNPTVDET